MSQILQEEKMTHTSQRDVAHKTPPQGTSKTATVAVTGVVLLLLAGGGFSVLKQHNERKALDVTTEQLAVQTVSVVHPKVESSNDQLTLPGQLQAFIESPIYARTNGYLLKWYKDIGSHVNKGEKLADIDTPEVDQELNQARAAQQQVEAQLQLAKTSAERWVNLRKSDSVSQQEVDQQTSTYAQAQANLAAAQANVRRLEQMESFKHVYAPFTGVVTKRTVDIGTLITAGGGGQKEMFDVAQVDPLRVYVSVPQAYAPSVRPGLKAYVILDEFPGQKFEGKVVRSAEAIDPSTRTLLTEVDVPNKDGRLIPGAFGRVSFEVPVKVERLTIPSNALLFRAEGPRAAVVEADGKINLKPVQVGRDLGTVLEIVNGLSPEDQVVMNPPDSITSGQQVNVRKDQPQAQGKEKKS
jgi:RND family efflux transporter MFP subunit